MKHSKTLLALLASVLVLVGVMFFLYPRWHQKQANIALQNAVSGSDAARVQQALTEGADVDMVADQGMTPLSRAAMRSQDDIARILIQHGANVRWTDVYGNTPLYLAAQYGSPEIVRMLLAKGANPNVQTRLGHTVLDVAQSIRRVRSGSSFPNRHPTIAEIDQVIALLHQAGAKSNRRQKRRAMKQKAPRTQVRGAFSC
jgi:hypothetical protein